MEGLFQKIIRASAYNKIVLDEAVNSLAIWIVVTASIVIRNLPQSISQIEPRSNAGSIGMEFDLGGSIIGIHFERFIIGNVVGAKSADRLV